MMSHFAPPSDMVALIDGDSGDTLTYHELHGLVGDATDALQAVLEVPAPVVMCARTIRCFCSCATTSRRSWHCSRCGPSVMP